VPIHEVRDFPFAALVQHLGFEVEAVDRAPEGIA
jgi:hypothetical protein